MVRQPLKHGKKNCRRLERTKNFTFFKAQNGTFTDLKSPKARKGVADGRLRGGELTRLREKIWDWTSWNGVEQGATDRDGWKSLLHSEG